MDRRESIKSLLLGSIATGLVLNGCAPELDTKEIVLESSSLYGRTVDELKRDQKLYSEKFLSEHELLTIAVICDIILPKNENFGAATQTGIVEFIEFIMKDLSEHQIPIRGGLMWLDNYSNTKFNAEFINCSNENQFDICDQIAYPEKTKPELKPGEAFFTRMRNLTLTGYFTSKMGIEDLGYKGNAPNVWDGVPEDILAEHGMKYDDEWLKKCVDHTKRTHIARWDQDGNLIS